MTLAALSYSAGGITAHYAFKQSPYLNGFDVILFRTFIFSTVIFIWGQIKRVNFFKAKKSEWFLIGLRVLFCFNSVLYFNALSYAPVGKVTLLFNTNPLLVFLAAWLILKENIVLRDILLAFLSFFGVFLLLKF